MRSHLYPYLQLDVDAVRSNIATMKRWCEERDVNLAPHIKTTMCRAIVEMQLEADASGVTVATVDQAESAVEWGCKDILIANEVVDLTGLSALRRLRRRAPDARIRCFVDSAYGVRLAADTLAEEESAFEVLVDVGAPAGRTGLRSVADAVAMCALVAGTAGLRLVGVAGFEGVVPNSRDADVVEDVDLHCQRVRTVFLEARDLFETNRPTFSMGGSAFTDRVVECLPTATDVPGTVRLLRSGCYVTHDHGTYNAVGPIGGLEAALTVRAVVVSVPEPGFVVIGAGRRDLPYDGGLPVVLGADSPCGAVRVAPWGIATKIFDHHLVVEGAAELSVGDVVRLGISHPCSAFDRWPEVVVADRLGRNVGQWQTTFDRGRGRV